jgi:hypothetical protein
MTIRFFSNRDQYVLITTDSNGGTSTSSDQRLSLVLDVLYAGDMAVPWWGALSRLGRNDARAFIT